MTYLGFVVLRLFLITGAMIFASATKAQLPPPLSCTARAAATPLIRAEGLAELVGDIIIECTGGTPTPAGQPLPTVDIQLTLNTTVTSRLTADPWSEALLLIDEPQPNDQKFCSASNLNVFPLNASCPITGTGTGEGTYNGSPGRPNIFQARQASTNSTTWLGVPLNAPPFRAPRVMRITNLRVNANQLGIPPAGTPMKIIGSIKINTGGANPVSLPVTDLGIIVAESINSLDFSVQDVITQPHCETHSPGQSVLQLRYRELFPAVFRRRNIAVTSQDPLGSTGNQDALGFPYQTESGFYNRNLPPPDGTAGLADHGTRLIARFNNVPNMVQVMVQTNPSSGTVSAQLINTDINGAGPFSAIPPTTSLPGMGNVFPVPIVGGTGRAVWEIINSDPQATETLPILVTTFFTSGGTFPTSPPIGTSTVTGSLAPLSTVNTSSSSTPIPRFVDSTCNPNLLTINNCRATHLLPMAAFQTANCSGSPTLQLRDRSQQSLTQLQFNTGLTSHNGGRDVFFATNPNGPADSVNMTASATVPLQSVESSSITSAWLTVEQNSTTTPVTGTVSVNPTGLPPGTYSGSVQVSGPGGQQSIPVSLTVPPPGPRFAPNAVTSAANYVSGAVAPGLLMVIFGTGLGPPNLAGLVLGPDGKVATSTGGTRVLIDGVPAPMVYARQDTVSFFVPFEVAGRASVVIEVEYQGVKSPPVTLPVVDAIPGILTVDFSGGGAGAILREDFSLVSRTNPAPINSVIQIYAVGAGQSTPAGETGRLADAPLKRPALPVTATIGGVNAPVEYVGDAPGLVEGVLQVNLRVPATVIPGDNVPVVIQVGSRRTPIWATVAVAP
ncbi:MAG TPA: hypothetical protein VNN17_03985 [Terriglobia bacterium]|nr:hypothetical protein [Terriglobia bacterium]